MQELKMRIQLSKLRAMESDASLQAKYLQQHSRQQSLWLSGIANVRISVFRDKGEHLNAKDYEYLNDLYGFRGKNNPTVFLKHNK